MPLKIQGYPGRFDKVNPTAKSLNISYLVVFIILLCSAAFASTREILTIGRATDKVVREHKRIYPIVTYLAERLKNDGVMGGDVVLEGNNNNQGVIDNLNSGQLDIVFESPFAAALYQKRCGAVPILLISREGLVAYQSFIFTRKDSPIKKPEDLLGHLIACEDPTSTSSYMWPKTSLENLGFNWVAVYVDHLIPENKIGYTFAGSEINVSSWVFLKKVDAGCLSSADWTNPEENPENYRMGNGTPNGVNY